MHLACGSLLADRQSVNVDYSLSKVNAHRMNVCCNTELTATESGNYRRIIETNSHSETGCGWDWLVLEVVLIMTGKGRRV